jgi:hypothetical protein
MRMGGIEVNSLSFDCGLNVRRGSKRGKVGEEGKGLVTQHIAPQSVPLSSLNVTLNSYTCISTPLSHYDSSLPSENIQPIPQITPSVSESLLHELHTSAYNAPNDVYNSQQSSVKIAPMKIYPVMKVRSVEPLDPSYGHNDRVG